MVKRVVLIVVVVIVGVSGVWGLGGQEIAEEYYHDFGDGNQVNFRFEDFFGYLKILLAQKTSQDNRIKIEIRNNLPNGLENIGENTTNLNNMPDWVKNINAVSGTYGWGILSADKRNEIGLPDPAKVSSSDIITANIFGRRNVTVIIQYKNSITRGTKTFNFEYFNGLIEFDFFHGEYDLFNTYFPQNNANGGWSNGLNSEQIYKIQCLSFMRLILFYKDDDIEIRNLFTTIVQNKLGISLINPAQYDVLKNWLSSPTIEQNDPAAKKIFLNGVWSFKHYFARHFSFYKQRITRYRDDNKRVEYTGPYLDYDKHGFEAIYGDWNNGVRNPYIAAYLLFLFQEQNKDAQGLLSYLIWKLNTELEYNPQQFRLVNIEEGKSLAESALKYISWGVEYTPYTKANVMSVDSSKNLVYGLNENKINEWIKGGTTGAQRHNYFPGLSAGSDAPKVTEKLDITLDTNGTHIITGEITTDILMLAARKKSHPENDVPINISKVDIWTSKNIAWSEGVIQQVVPNSVTNKSILYDKNRNDACVINANNDGTMEVGYAFNNTEQVQSLLLIGKYTVPANTNGEIEIEVEDALGTTVIKKQAFETNIAKDCPASASSFGGALNNPNPQLDHPDQAVDGVTGQNGTWWESRHNEAQSYITIDLTSEEGVTKSVSKISIDWHFSYAKQYTISVSDNNVNWTPIGEVRNKPEGKGNHEIDVINFNKIVRCRYIKIDCLEKVVPINKTEEKGYGIYEIEVYSPGFKEYTTLQTSKCYKSIQNTVADDNANIEYKYYILNAPLEINQIKLKIRNVTSTVIQELLVFPEDPIKFVSSIPGNVINLNQFLEECIQDASRIARKLFFNSDTNESKGYLGVGVCTADTLRIRFTPQILNNNMYQKKLVKNELVEIWGREEVEINGVKSWWYLIRTESGIEGYVPTRTGEVQNISYYRHTFLLSFNFRKQQNIETIILWEIPNAQTGTAFKSDIRPLTLLNSFLKTALLNPYEQINNTKLQITSPFKGDGGRIIAGNPLPYASLGIDSPRTFAYKMYEQYKAHNNKLQQNENENETEIEIGETSIKTTLAVDILGFESFQDVYSDEIDMYKRQNNTILRIDPSTFKYTNSDFDKNNIGDYKPFLPGFCAPNKEGYVFSANSLYCPEKIAGVDSVGLFIGALGMSKIKDKVVNAYNVPVGKIADGYYQMNKDTKVIKTMYNEDNYDVNLELLDIDGKPTFYPSVEFGGIGKDTANLKRSGTHYKLTMHDIERNTVLIPDISMLQKGDLIVRYLSNEIEEEPHIGIVVGFGWDTEGLEQGDPIPDQPSYGDNARKWWGQVYVVSVRRGMQQVTLGTWGNPEGGFGGFTDEPEVYQIRRLLVVKDNIDTLVRRTDEQKAWELVEEVCFKIKEHYPLKELVPRLRNPNNIFAVNCGINSMIPKAQNDFKIRYYREFPSTSLSKKADKALFNEYTTIIYGLDGWQYPNPANHNNLCADIRYHRGIDVHSSGPKPSANSINLEGKGWPFYAPEDGLFWIYSSNDNQIGNGSQFRIAIPDGEGGVEYIGLEDYKHIWFGFIGVLVTNPRRPRDGRIYIFCHLGPTDENDDNNGDWNERDKLPYHNDYIEKGYKQYPKGLYNAIYVKAGDWIGYVGNRGFSEGMHIHLEVYEFFKESPNRVGGEWERVDPLSCFSEVLYRNSNNVVTYGWWRIKGNWNTITQNEPIMNGVKINTAYNLIVHDDSTIGGWISVDNYDKFVTDPHDTGLFDRLFIMEQTE